jgi:hypothetical protein
MLRIGRLFLGLAVPLLACQLAVPARAAVPGLPVGWDSTDVGTNLPGYVTVQSSGIWTMAGSGADIWNLGDAFRYTYTTMTGDFAVTCRVLRQTNSDGWAKVGVMIRDVLLPGSRQFMLVRTPSNGVDPQWRLEMDQESFHFKGNAYSGHLPVWLRVQRTGSLFVSFASNDGVNWKQVGPVLSINMGTKVLAGICLTAHNDGKLCYSDVDNVSLSQDVAILGPERLQAFPGNRSALLTWNGLPDAKGYNIYRLTPSGRVKLNQSPVLNWFFVDSGDTADGLPDAVTQRYVVTAVLARGESLPSAAAVVTPMQPLAGRFVGYDINTSTPGRAQLDAPTGRLIVEGSGDDIWDNFDRMYFLATPMRGSVELSARILARPWRTNEWAKTGLMVRESLEGPSRHVMLMATPDHGLRVQWRHDTGGGSSDADAGTVDSYPLFLRIRRTGGLIQCYRSDDGTDYEKVGDTIQLDNLTPTAFVGFAATAHNEGSTTHAEFDQITLR